MQSHPKTQDLKYLLLSGSFHIFFLEMRLKRGGWGIVPVVGAGRTSALNEAVIRRLVRE
jgi:hypothetical protein